MPEKATLESAAKAKRAGRAATTQAGPFVREAAAARVSKGVDEAKCRLGQ